MEARPRACLFNLDLIYPSGKSQSAQGALHSGGLIEYPLSTLSGNPAIQ
jgi:hypothetical protein